MTSTPTRAIISTKGDQASPCEHSTKSKDLLHWIDDSSVLFVLVLSGCIEYFAEELIDCLATEQQDVS